MLDRVTGMQVFVRVAALGSFSAAGRALGLSQTGVTKHVAALEARLGARLLHRTTRRLTLTEAGRTYLEACERILAEIAEAEAGIGAEALEARGTLRLNVPLSFGVRRIAPALAAFCAAHPAVTVELGLNDRRVDLIEEGWDLAVRIGPLADSSLIARPLAPCRLALCAAPPTSPGTACREGLPIWAGTIASATPWRRRDTGRSMGRPFRSPGRCGPRTARPWSRRRSRGSA